MEMMVYGSYSGYCTHNSFLSQSSKASPGLTLMYVMNFLPLARSCNKSTHFRLRMWGWRLTHVSVVAALSWPAAAQTVSASAGVVSPVVAMIEKDLQTALPMVSCPPPPPSVSHKPVLRAKLPPPPLPGRPPSKQGRRASMPQPEW